MRNLLSANCVRLLKSRELWTTALVLFGISAAYMINVAIQGMEQIARGYPCQLEMYYFQMSPFICVFFAAFSSLFIGTEYGDGTMRNKLAVGHSRTKVYLASYVSALMGCELLAAVWLLGGVVGVPALGFMKMNPTMLAIYLGIIALYTAAYTGIFVLVSMLNSNKAANAVITIMLALALAVAAFLIYNALCEPEMAGGLVMTEDGIQEVMQEPNPAYVGGIRRQIYQLLADCLPGGQAIEIADQTLARPALSAAASVVITAGTLLAGCALFQRKDLK